MGKRKRKGLPSRHAASSASPCPLLPKNWPQDVTYLTEPTYSRHITPSQLALLRTPDPSLPRIPPAPPPGPWPDVLIAPITAPSHPARGQRGLFAARDLPPGSFVVPYLGHYYHAAGMTGTTEGAGAEEEEARRHAAASDYDLWLDRGAGVAVDAARAGNEARFVNDYRGTGARRANAEFREVWDAVRGEKGMGVFVLPLGKRRAAKLARRRREGKVAAGGGRKRAGGGEEKEEEEEEEDDGWIRKGKEILVSYGKGFWEKRREEEMGGEGEGGFETEQRYERGQDEAEPCEEDDEEEWEGFADAPSTAPT
ncbi:uncharacterized protein E0L32_010968 [Thyridium curvatum]|uniref:SET domain-containing protein n=1 Tax=Thyridium curvatum TaxID=1093900 RepID=A0A507AIP5_9PEZI|nr:uncharacterized protein E0L32_010968 [Thyridium curvatum]TPX07073.1 hypothetical protein E0L32_010968 [Thyridium curvatum]